VHRQYEVAEIAYDKHGVEPIIQWIENKQEAGDENFYETEVVQVDQTYTGMSLGCQSFLTLIYSGALVHEGGKLMEWCCGNAVSSELNGAIRWNKDQSQDKIDPVISDTMAIGRACLSEDFVEPVEYFDEDGGLLEGSYL